MNFSFSGWKWRRGLAHGNGDWGWRIGICDDFEEKASDIRQRSTLRNAAVSPAGTHCWIISF
jgi:hypothetical protein